MFCGLVVFARCLRILLHVRLFVWENLCLRIQTWKNHITIKWRSKLSLTSSNKPYLERKVIRLHNWSR